MSSTPALVADLSLSPVQTIAITGGKGGVGKSNVAVNLAVALSTAGRKVLLWDADLGLGNVDCLMNLQSPYNLSHVLRGQRSLSEVLMVGAGGVKVIPGATGVMDLARMSQIEHANLIGMFSELAVDADIMIIDLATGLSDSVLSFSRAAREVIVVVCDEPTAVQDACSTIRVLHDTCQIRRFRIIANQTDSSRHGLDLYSALTRYTEKHVDVLLDYCGSIPFDQLLKRSVAEQKSVVQAYPRSASALAFKKLATRVDRWPKPQTPGGHIEFFVERLIQAGIGTR